jgi:hypothetical protein
VSRVYVAQIVGDGTRPNPYRARVVDLPQQRTYALGIPSDAQGRPVRMWTLADVEATDFTAVDADTAVALLEDRANLDNVPSTQRRNQINTFFANHGITTVALAGESYRVIGNKLLTELGAIDRL